MRVARLLADLLDFRYALSQQGSCSAKATEGHLKRRGGYPSSAKAIICSVVMTRSRSGSRPSAATAPSVAASLELASARKRAMIPLLVRYGSTRSRPRRRYSDCTCPAGARGDRPPDMPGRARAGSNPSRAHRSGSRPARWSGVPVGSMIMGRSSAHNLWLRLRFTTQGGARLPSHRGQ